MTSPGTHITGAPLAKPTKFSGLSKEISTSCSKDIKAKAYKALVRPHLEYAAAVTDPYQSKYIQMLDRFQRRAARFVVGDFRRKSSVTKLIQELEWESLAQRRKTARLCQFYFVHKGEFLTHLPSFNTGTPIIPAGTSPLIHTKLLKQEMSDIRTYILFLSRTVLDWNRLPLVSTTQLTLEKFKASLVGN